MIYIAVLINKKYYRNEHDDFISRNPIMRMDLSLGVEIPCIRSLLWYIDRFDILNIYTGCIKKSTQLKMYVLQDS